ncbi:MAG: hypothetical protein AAF236_00115, partial [Verrucomicrobiota bacterium]
MQSDLKASLVAKLEGLTGRWRELSDRALIELTGPDRVRFLNGQITQQVDQPLEEKRVPACICNAKGKVGAFIWVGAIGESLWLDVDQHQFEWTLERLERYLIADDCELHGRRESHRLIHWLGEAAGSNSSRVLIPGTDQILTTEQTSDPKGEAIPDLEWRVLEMLTGNPNPADHLQEEYFPEELQLTERTVDFHKGCYLGQEVISKIEHIGRVRRRLETRLTSLDLGEDS